MKTLFSLSFCCFLFVLSGLMTSCEKPTSKQEPAAIPAKPAVETPVEASGEPKGEKPVAKPEASAAAAPKKEPVAAPEKPNVGKTVFKYPVTIKATVKNSEAYEYRTGFGGDEQGASIKVQAGHFEKSEIVRDASTSFEPVYKYKPKGDYVGKDAVELWLVEHEIGGGPDDPGKTMKTRVVINFTITE